MTISDVAALAAPVSDVAAIRRRHGADTAPERASRIRHYAMTAPTFFAVEYAINPWMDTSTAVDTHVAMNQWETLRQTYKELGHTVELVEPVAGLPDMVYAANGGLLVNGKAVVARFAYPQREGESVAYAEWMTRHGFDPAETRHVNEGQGDLLVVGSIVLAGYGFRTERQAHAEIAAHIQMPVVSLELVDPRFYHLDTALAVLDDTTIAYYPPAFSDEARTTLLELFPDAIEVAERRRECARPQRGVRRPERGHARSRHRLRRATARGRIPAHRRRPVRTAQGRRIRQMLHAGGTSVTILDTVAGGGDPTTVTATDAAIALDDRYVAHNYSPLPVVAASADGAWITDVEGRRYLDCLAAYSAVNFGHRNPEIVAAAHAQLDTVTLVSRAFHSDRLGPFCEALAELCGKDMVLPMNSGAEAVESGIKVARKWGTDVKGVPAGAGQYRRGAQQLPRPHHHDHQLLRRRGRAPRLRPVHARASGRCRSATPTRWPPRSTTTPSRCCSSPSRVRPASSCRPTTTCRACARCAPSATC